jgi:hypothetical protein
MQTRGITLMGRRRFKDCAVLPKELRLGVVANHFNVVSIRINYESRVVICVVTRTQTGRPIVFTTRLQSCLIESVNLLTIVCNECEVEVRRLFFALVQAQ